MYQDKQKDKQKDKQRKMVSGFSYGEKSQSSVSSSGFGSGHNSVFTTLSPSTSTSIFSTNTSSSVTVSKFGSAFANANASFGASAPTQMCNANIFGATSTNTKQQIFGTNTTTTTTNTNTFSLSFSNSPIIEDPNIQFRVNSTGFGTSSFGLKQINDIEKKINTEEQNLSTSSKDTSKENEEISLQSHIPLANVSYCKTLLKSKEYKFVWKIDNFKKIHRLEDILIAEILKQSEPLPYEIHMKVFRASDNNLHDNPENNTSLLKDKIAFYILPTVGFKCTFTVNIIKDIKFIQCKVASGTGLISNLTLLYETTAEELYKVLYKEDTLLIEFIFEVHRKCSLSTTYTNSSKSKDSNLNSKDLNYNKYCKSVDEQSIKFIVNENDYIIPIKLLLATNSSYFDELYTNKEKEKDITDEIISDRKQAIFRIMVSFIKTGLIPAIINVNDLKDLLRLAHKFDVQTLKLICEECLLSYITPSTAIDFMQLAVSCDAKCLEKNVENFLKIHMQDIISLKEFQLLSPEDSQKIIKIMEETEYV